MEYHRFLRTKNVPPELRGKLIAASDRHFPSIREMVTKRKVDPAAGLDAANNFGLNVLDILYSPTAGKLLQGLCYGIWGCGATVQLENRCVHVIPMHKRLDSSFLTFIQKRNLPRARPVTTLDGTFEVVSESINVLKFMSSDRMPEFAKPTNYPEFIAKQLRALVQATDPAAMQNLLSVALRMHIDSDLVTTSNRDVYDLLRLS